ncbi:hypothetical protein Tco_0866053 [Tanacetum coccineum]
MLILNLNIRLQYQLPSHSQGPMNKHFNAFNTLESRRTMFKDMVSLLEAAKVNKKANAEGEKWEKNNPKTPTEDNDAQNPNQTQLEQHLRDATMANAQGEQLPAQELSNVEQTSLVNEENVLVLHALVEKSSEVNTLEKKVTDDEPPPNGAKMTIEQVTEHLSKTTSSIFSPTPPREPTLPRDPTPPRDESKGKGITTEEPIKEIMPFMEEGGSAPKMPNFMPFSTPNGQMTNDDVMAQLKEMKRLADLKAEKEKSEKSLKKILNPATIRAQAQKMAESTTEEENMRITRGNDLLNLTVYESLRAKFQWVILQAKALGIPPPPELSTFGISMDDKKRKRSSKILQEVFVKENEALGIPLPPEFSFDLTSR